MVGVAGRFEELDITSPEWRSPSEKRPLERSAERLNRFGDSLEAGFVIQDAGWSKEASMNAETLFAGFAGSHGWRG